MIDLAKLKQEAESGEGDRTVVSRQWLQQALTELQAGREAQAQLGQVFAGKPRRL